MTQKFFSRLYLISVGPLQIEFFTKEERKDQKQAIMQRVQQLSLENDDRHAFELLSGKQWKYIYDDAKNKPFDSITFEPDFYSLDQLKNYFKSPKKPDTKQLTLFDKGDNMYSPTDEGNYEFLKAGFDRYLNPPQDDPAPKKNKSDENNKKGNNNRYVLIFLGVVIVVGLAGGVAWYLLSTQQKDKQAT